MRLNKYYVYLHLKETNINTGIYYTSAKEAAIIYGLDYKNLNYNLNKEDQSKNNTHIIYV